MKTVQPYRCKYTQHIPLHILPNVSVALFQLMTLYMIVF